MGRVDIDGMRNAFASNRYFITTHAKQRMAERRVDDNDLKQVILNGCVIEEYPEARPFPKVLCMAEVRGEPLYVSCAFGGKNVYVITVHWYDPNIWTDPWTRREG